MVGARRRRRGWLQGDGKLQCSDDPHDLPYLRAEVPALQLAQPAPRDERLLGQVGLREASLTACSADLLSKLPYSEDGQGGVRSHSLTVAM